MADYQRALTLTLHGLEAYGLDVDGEVFARKLIAFLKGIRLSDKEANGRRRHKLLLADLRKNTASAVIREQIYAPGPPPSSGLAQFERALDAVYHERPEARRLPLGVVREIATLNRGAGHTFAFAEVKSSTGKLIRIDEFLEKRATALVQALEGEKRNRLVRFAGTAYASFEGDLKVADFRGDAWTGVLVLTAGGKEIECTVSRMALPDIKEALNVHVRAYGLAHYSGNSGLPDRIEVISAKPVRTRAQADLTRWRGAFDIAPQSDPLEDWH